MLKTIKLKQAGLENQVTDINPEIEIQSPEADNESIDQEDDLPLILYQICSFIQDALITDYYMSIAIIQGSFAKGAGVFRIEFNLSDESPGDDSALGSFMDDIEEAIAELETNPRPRMLMGNVQINQNDDQIALTNIEDLVTILHTVSEMKKHFWTHLPEVYSAGEQQDHFAALADNSEILFNTQARGPYITAATLAADLKRAAAITKDLHYARRYTLHDLDQFVEDHYQANRGQFGYFPDTKSTTGPAVGTADVLNDLMRKGGPA